MDFEKNVKNVFSNYGGACEVTWLLLDLDTLTDHVTCVLRYVNVRQVFLYICYESQHHLHAQIHDVIYSFLFLTKKQK